MCYFKSILVYTDKKMVLSSYNSRLMKVYSDPIV